MNVHVLNEVNAVPTGHGRYTVRCPECRHTWPETPVIVSSDPPGLCWGRVTVSMACAACGANVDASMPLVPDYLVAAHTIAEEVRLSKAGLE